MRRIVEISAELSKLSELLEGYNYSVFLRCDVVEHALEDDEATIVKKVFPDSHLQKVVEVDAASILHDIDRDILHAGDHSHGPENDTFQSEDFQSLYQSIRGTLEIACNDASKLLKFWFAEGHPAYPVFWDFAFLLRSKTQSTIWIGSSSD